MIAKWVGCMVASTISEFQVAELNTNAGLVARRAPRPDLPYPRLLMLCNSTPQLAWLRRRSAATDKQPAGQRHHSTTLASFVSLGVADDRPWFGDRFGAPPFATNSTRTIHAALSRASFRPAGV